MLYIVIAVTIVSFIMFFCGVAKVSEFEEENWSLLTENYNLKQTNKQMRERNKKMIDNLRQVKVVRSEFETCVTLC